MDEELLLMLKKQAQLRKQPNGKPGGISTLFENAASEIEKLQRERDELEVKLERAVLALESNGFVDHGAEHWKPPVRFREDQKPEIQAKAVEDFTEYASCHVEPYAEVQLVALSQDYANTLRTEGEK